MLPIETSLLFHCPLEGFLLTTDIDVISSAQKTWFNQLIRGTPGLVSDHWVMDRWDSTFKNIICPTFVLTVHTPPLSPFFLPL